MASFTGTTGNDAITGTADDDSFSPLTGMDTVSGGAGTDSLLLDWSRIYANGGTGTLTATDGSLSGTFLAGSGTTGITFSGIERLDAVLTSGSDRLSVDAAALSSGAILAIKGGAGTDTLIADFSGFANTSFTLGTNYLITADHGTWAGFEQFDLTLGAGINRVTLQSAADVIRSTGGVDTLDLGGGRDTWIADFSRWSSALSFGWDGDRNMASVSNGTFVKSVEAATMLAGTGNDSFFLNGANGVAVDGGTGRDLLVWDESGQLSAPYSAVFLAGPSGTFEGWVRTSTFAGVEQVNAVLSDADNVVFVDTANLIHGATMNLDGGGGDDELQVDFSTFADTQFSIDESGTAYTSHGTYLHFESFTMALGAGVNAVATGDGDDTIYSLGGVDRVDGGAGHDFWAGDFSNRATGLTFDWSATGAQVSNGTSLAGIEAGYIIGTGAADRFTIDGPAVFDVHGGGGIDFLTRTAPAEAGTPVQVLLFDDAAGFSGFIGPSRISGIEQVRAILGAANDAVYLDGAPLTAGATLELDGGAGTDSIALDLSTIPDLSLTVSASGDATGPGWVFRSFENWSIGLASGANTVTLGGGDDVVIAGHGGTNRITLGGGNDEARGGSGSDTVDGGDGSDRFVATGLAGAYSVDRDGLGGYRLTERASGTVDHLTAIEQLAFDDATLSLAPYSIATNTPTAGDDQLVGTDGADQLAGLTGDDSLSGQGGNDWLDGGPGNDTIAGGDGSDTLTYANASAGISVDLALMGQDQATGGSGTDRLVDRFENLVGSAYADTLFGNELSNRIEGLAGDDRITGRGGSDVLVGGTGDDTYIVDDADDLIVEVLGEGTDSVVAPLSWTLAPHVENLSLAGMGNTNAAGNDLANVLTGNAGANRLDGGTGGDTLIGGAGDDTYVVDNPGDTIVETAANGRDTILASLGWTLGANLEDLTLIGTASADGTGNDLANVLTGNAAANRLDGGIGGDTLIGGGGNDTYVVDNSADAIFEAPDEGLDAVFASIDWSLAANVENLTLTGTAALNATGNGLANALTGNAAANRLDGGSGADWMAGGLGDDTYIVDMAADATVEAAGPGNDTVLSSVDWTLSANVENLVLVGTAAINGTGNELANQLTGNAAANRLDGGAGADSMAGGLGDDSYVVDSAADIITERPDEGVDTVLTPFTWTLGADFENLILTGTAAVNGTGNALSNALTGNSAANKLDGGAGADVLAGGGGNDSYVVDNGADRIVELAAEGTDTVTASVSYTLAANVENLTLSGSAALSGTGNAVANTIRGNFGNNVLSGLGGSDNLSGGSGNDVLIGGSGADTLSGGTGSDRFRFDTLETSSQRDVISDFVHGTDRFEISRAAFPGLAALPAGALDTVQFTRGSAATTANHHLVYNASNGALFYDPDGSGSQAAIQIALLSTKPAIDATDFTLI